MCNLVLTDSSRFLRFWLADECRDGVLSLLPKEDLPNVRLVCHHFAQKAAPYLFNHLVVTFKASTFTRPARMAALERVGHHVQSLTFNMPHTPETFLPPLVDPFTGEERVFHYVPQTSAPGTLLARVKLPKYGSWEMTDLLIKQYPPLFHAATNVPAFIRAFCALTAVKELAISCPGQDPAQRYRRSTVDYALISLRIAVERAPLVNLETLSLLPIHPAGPFYLQPLKTYGALPNAAKRWSQIRTLVMEMEAFPSTALYAADHLKLLHTYLGSFTSNLTALSFRWTRKSGPCPLTLDMNSALTEPQSSRPSTASRPTPFSSAASPTYASQMSPVADKPVQPLVFPALRRLILTHASVEASQIQALFARVARGLRAADFDEVTLCKGSWDEAFQGLRAKAANTKLRKRTRSNEDSARPREVGQTSYSMPQAHEQREELPQLPATHYSPAIAQSEAGTETEAMDVPLMLSPIDIPSPPATNPGRYPRPMPPQLRIAIDDGIHNPKTNPYNHPMPHPHNLPSPSTLSPPSTASTTTPLTRPPRRPDFSLSAPPKTPLIALGPSLLPPLPPPLPPTPAPGCLSANRFWFGKSRAGAAAATPTADGCHRAFVGVAGLSPARKTKDPLWSGCEGQSRKFWKHPIFSWRS